MCPKTECLPLDLAGLTIYNISKLKPKPSPARIMMMMKKMALPLLIPFIAAITLLAGCTSSPSKVAQDALEFWKSNNYEDLYALASSNLKTQLPRDFFLSQAGKGDFPLLLSCRINKTKGDAKTTKVDAAITIPDFAKMSTEDSAAFLNNRVTDKQIREILTKGATAERVFSMELSKESDGWRIHKFRPFDTALDLHHRIMAAASYKNSVKIVSLNVSKADPRLGDDLVMIEGKIENSGGEMLSKVELTVTFKDAAGKVVHEAKVYPFLMTGCTSADVAKQMQNSGEFKSYISTPPAWAGNVEGSVTNIELGGEDIGCGGHAHHAAPSSS